MILLHSRFALFKQALAFGAITIIHVPELKKSIPLKNINVLGDISNGMAGCCKENPMHGKLLQLRTVSRFL